MIYGLDLFSGIGGITLALSDWVVPIAYCEIDRYCQGVLLSRMSEGQLPIAPIWDDVTTLRAEHLPIKPDIIYGGFPCQDISVAGRGVGLAGKRSGLFFEIARLVGELRPRFVFLENVPAINLRGQNAVISTLTELGYDCRWTIVSAAEVGANHLRRRWFCLADSDGDGSARQGENRKVCDDGAKIFSNRLQTTEGAVFRGNGNSKNVADSDSSGCRERRRAESSGTQFDTIESGGEISDAIGKFRGERRDHSAGVKSRYGKSIAPIDAGTNWWSVEPNVGRVAHGIPCRVDRLKGLGNAVVPLQAKVAFERLLSMGEVLSL